MKNSDREAQIVRIQSTSFQSELSTALEAKLRQAVVGVTKATLEDIWKVAKGTGIQERLSGV